MSKHTIDEQFLTVTAIEAVGGVYSGTIAAVTLEDVRNPFSAQTSKKPVLHFEDGAKLCPNEGTKRALIAELGKESDDWAGQIVKIGLRQRGGQVQKYLVTATETDTTGTTKTATPEAEAAPTEREADGVEARF